MKRLRLPPQRFYWALLDASALPHRPSPRQLGYLFESVLPVPVEDVHAVYRRCPRNGRDREKKNGSRHLACGIERAVLDGAAGEAIELTPESLPSFLNVTAIDADGLNLLSGEFEPRPVARLRRLWRIQVAALLLVCSGLLVLGIELRAGQLRSEAAALARARADALSQALGTAAASPRVSGQPPELLLRAELRRLRQTRAEPASEARLEDAALNLAALIGAWPSDDTLYVRTEHLSVTEGVMTVRAVLPSAADAQRLAERLGTVDGWRLQQPEVSGYRNAVQASLRWARAEEDAG